MSGLVLGVDSSTQATKVEVREADSGRLVASGRAPHRLESSPPRSEQDPQQWWEALRLAIKEAGVTSVDAISVAGQQHGLVAIDRDGQVIRPAKLWNDLESAPQCRRLIEQLSPQQWADACGSVPVPSFTITKLAWLKECEEDAFDRLAYVLLPHSWLNFRLTGDRLTDRGDASGTGYWSPGEGSWRTDLLDLIAAKDWREMLPEVVPPFERAGELSGTAAEELGLEPGAVVAPGTGDNMAAALGLGMDTGDVAVSIGTSGTVFTVSETPTADASGDVAGFADATGRFLPLVCTVNAARVTDSFARWLAADQAEFDRLATDATGSGPILIPYLDGERTPNRPDATGVLHGLTSATTRADLARAAVLGVVLGLADALDALLKVVAQEPTRILLVGGAASSRAYRSLLADVLARPIEVPEGSEWVARGACVQAAAALAGTTAAEVHRRWGAVAGDRIAPPGLIDATAVRARYAELRG